MQWPLARIYATHGCAAILEAREPPALSGGEIHRYAVGLLCVRRASIVREKPKNGTPPLSIFSSSSREAVGAAEDYMRI